MTMSLRKATLALLGGAALVIAASGTASAGAPNGYFENG
jgi:energy-converting hydrogenase Eha subunit H